LPDVLDTVHGGLVHERRARVLASHFAELIPADATVLDVGCGDGLIGSLVQSARPDLSVKGIDIAARPESHIPVDEFDGRSIPYASGEFDAVMLVDVLHHADEPLTLLGEAARVADRAVVLKDVTPLGPLSDATLRFMDWVGNARHGVPLPYDFWSQRQWRDAFARAGLRVEEERRRLGLYPVPFRWLFEKRMHFILRLRPIA
jgi:SAM-dependent methyltransferase